MQTQYLRCKWQVVTRGAGGGGDCGNTQPTVWYCGVSVYVRACMCVSNVLFMGECPEEEERLFCYAESLYKEISSHAIGGSCFQE